ncbi:MULTISPECIES: hypothetical protein [Rhodococcus]|uniref:hypothetical protein n=1 Tax=Rhodococcus TaxID=1827 RepID=UPI00215588F1|nr:MULTISPECIES: hypothetical protein [Rhodococcus]WKX01806.1 hypothetical protein Q3O43_27935 [Rhodococcus aetherivorans]
MPDAWVLVVVAEVEEIWTVSAHPGPIWVHRCRAARRLGLELRWPGEHTCKAGSLPGVTIDLVNTANRKWINDAGDQMTVRGWLLDKKGEPIRPALSLFSHAPTLPTLNPGDRISLRVTLVTREVVDFPPGRYALAAELNDLGADVTSRSLDPVRPNPRPVGVRPSNGLRPHGGSVRSHFRIRGPASPAAPEEERPAAALVKSPEVV